ncbi:MAG: SDR family NAD(P)-dependent oxidoreductase [Flavobacteriales bacterium]|nr:SDR family NAD(P)-dependent oxidoreductase [Flavobacteriales bacterium]
MNKVAFITGATSGFGRAIAHRLAEGGFDVIITGRREERLSELSAELTQKYKIKVLPICFDVRNPNETALAVHALSSEWRKITVLINNAGLALGREPFQDGNLADWEQMIDTNVKGLIYVSKEVIPLMHGLEGATIINMGSIAGKDVYPGGNVYSASKAAVDSLTKSMRIDLLPQGIRVGQIAPGAADTEFSLVRFKGNSEIASKVYVGFEPLMAVDIAEAAWFMISRPAHVCINDLVIMPAAQANATQFYKK